MNHRCPHCQAELMPGDRFCPSCGQRLVVAPGETHDDVHPLSTSDNPAATPPARRQRRSWYRRKRFMIPLVLLLLIAASAAGTYAWFTSRYDDVNTVSTPPPEISSDRLGGEEGIRIDTGPAQEAVRNANGESNDASGNGNLAIAREIDQSRGNSAQTPDATQNVAAAAGQGDAAGGAVAMIRDVEGAGPLAAPDDAAKADDGSVNILLMGVDARPGEPIDIEVRPDTLAVLHLDGDTGSCRILSVPRDSRTELPGYGLSKVNHALAVGGVPYQVLVTENLLGITIDHFGLIDFSGIEGLVEAVGGVEVVNETAFTVGDMTFEQGPIELDGEHALAFARYRGGPDGDFGRMGRQQQVVRALINQTSGMDVVTGAYKLLGSVEGHVKTDLSPTDLIDLASDFRSTCTDETVEMQHLQGTVGTFPDPLLHMDLSFVTLDPADIREKVDWLTGSR